jgi:hypothetical protein
VHLYGRVGGSSYKLQARTVSQMQFAFKMLYWEALTLSNFRGSFRHGYKRAKAGADELPRALTAW